MLFKNYNKIIANGNDEKLKIIRKDILEILSSSIDAVDPYKSVKKHFNKNFLNVEEKKFDLNKYNNIYLVAFGKASIGMAEAVTDSVNIAKGIAVTNDKEKKVFNRNIQTISANHPIPNQNSIKAADKIINLLEKTKKDDLVLILISGGGSALLCKPRIGLKDLQKTTDILLKSGANIKEINTIRKHLSYVKGGQLLKYTKSNVIALVISDIIEDPLEFIASGPTYPDSTTFSDIQNIFEKYNISHDLPISVIDLIKKGIKGEISETPKLNDSVFEIANNFIISNNKLACFSALNKAEKLGYKTMFLTSAIEGEAKDIGNFLIDKTINYKTYAEKFLFVSGGETTVTIRGDGKGGRNQEMVLSTVKKIKDNNIVFCSFATDGIDGVVNAAGAISDKFTYKKSKKLNIDPEDYLKTNDSYNFFKKLGDLIITGPTGTNVMDIQLIALYK